MSTLSRYSVALFRPSLCGRCTAFATTQAAHASSPGIFVGKSDISILLTPLFADTTTVLKDECPSCRCQVNSDALLPSDPFGVATIATLPRCSANSSRASSALAPSTVHAANAGWRCMMSSLTGYTLLAISTLNPPRYVAPSGSSNSGLSNLDTGACRRIRGARVNTWCIVYIQKCRDQILG